MIVAGAVTVLIPKIILGSVLGCSTICLEVPDRGLAKEYTAAPTMNDDSRKIDNRPSDEQAVILCIYCLCVVKFAVLTAVGGLSRFS